MDVMDCCGARCYEIASCFLCAVGFLTLAVGFLSFVSPKKSIALYQWIMRGFNWRVEPIDWNREVRNTKWLGLLLAVLSLVAFGLKFRK